MSLFDFASHVTWKMREVPRIDQLGRNESNRDLPRVRQFPQNHLLLVEVEVDEQRSKTKKEEIIHWGSE